jgi:hypothetical protein
MLQTSKVAFAILASALTAPLSFGQTATIQAQQDSTLYEDATGMTANGSAPLGFTGGNSSALKRRYLIQFDVASAIPAGSTITSARLELTVEKYPNFATDSNYGAHLVPVAWGEGPSIGTGMGTPAQPGDATWLHTFYPGTLWSNTGGDFTAVASGSSPMNALGLHSISSAGLAADVQGFLDNPTSNFGWAIKSDTESSRTTRGFKSREVGAGNGSPVLVVDYTTPSAFTPFCDPASNNSSGGPAILTGAFGSGFGSDLHLDVTGGPLPLADGSRMLGYFLVGNMNAGPGISLSDGQFCLVGVAGASFGRYNVAGTNRTSLGLFDASGDLQNLVGTGGVSGFGFDVPSEIEIAGFAPTTIMAGDTYHFQAWYRDTLAGSGNSNFSNGLSVAF